MKFKCSYQNCDREVDRIDRHLKEMHKLTGEEYKTARAACQRLPEPLAVISPQIANVQPVPEMPPQQQLPEPAVDLVIVAAPVLFSPGPCAVDLASYFTPFYRYL